MPPTRPVEINRPQININLHRIDTQRATAQVDPEKIDKALSKMIDPAQLGAAYQSYFKLAGEWIGTLSTRAYESETKALSAQAQDPTPYKAKWFEGRDTSKGIAGKDFVDERILFDPEMAHRQGWFTKKEAKALDGLSRGSPPSDPNLERKEAWSVKDPNAGGRERSMQQGGGQGQEEREQPEDHQQPQGSSRGNRLAAVSGPPVPPGGGSSAPSQWDLDPNIKNSLGRRDQDFLNSLFPAGNSFADFIRALLPITEMSQQVFLERMGNIQRRRQLKLKIMGEINRLDPTKPADAAKLYKLQNEMQMLNSDDSQDYDEIMRCRAEANKITDLERSILETMMKAPEAIARNFVVR